VQPAYSADKDLEVSLDSKEVTLGQSIRMDIVFPGVSEISEPDLPAIDGFNAEYLRSYNLVSKTDTGILRSKRFTYVLMPNKTGTFSIGPFEFPAGDDKFKSKKLAVRVVSSMEIKPDKSDSLSNEEKFMARDNIFLLIAAGKNKVYMNEVIPIAVGLYYKDLAISDIEYPLIEQKGFSIAEFRTPQVAKKDIKGYNYRIVTFKSKAFATKPGNIQLGPATIMCKIQTGTKDPLTGRKKKSSLNLESKTKDIEVLPFPSKGMPSNFSGAIGDFKFDIEVEPTGYVNIGDAITILMKITGSGNFDMLSAPDVREVEGLAVYDATLKSESEKAKVFELIVVPKDTGVKEIPEIGFSFFNPATEKYETIRRGPFRVNVYETEKSKEAKIIEKTKEITIEPEREAIGKDIIYIKDVPGTLRQSDTYLCKDRGFLFFHLIPLLIYFTTLVAYKRHQKLKNDIRYARDKFAYKKVVKALKKVKSLIDTSNAEEFYASLYSAMQEYFGDKLNLPPGGITQDIADTTLKEKGIDPEGLLMVKTFFHDSDVARFTPAHSETKNMLVIFDRAEKIAVYFRNL